MIRALVVAATVLAAVPAAAEPLSCSLDGYKAQDGLTASVSGGALTVAWAGDRSEQLRVRFTLAGGAPTIDELAVRRAGGEWGVLARQVTPEYPCHLRAPAHEQPADGSPARARCTAHRRDRRSLSLGPVLGRSAGSRCRREPELESAARARRRKSAGPPSTAWRDHARNGYLPRERLRGANQRCPARGGIPRRAGRPVRRASSIHLLQRHRADSAGRPRDDHAAMGRLQVPRGPQGPERGRPARASSGATSRIPGRTTGSAARRTTTKCHCSPAAASSSPNAAAPVRLRCSRRRTRIFWAREIAINLGYDWYRKDSATRRSRSVSGRRRTSTEFRSTPANFALYSARPAPAADDGVPLRQRRRWRERRSRGRLAFTHGDRFKPLPGYQVMNHHYHMDLGRRLGEAGSLDADIPDLVALKSLGINIVSQVDSVGLQSRRRTRHRPKRPRRGARSRPRRRAGSGVRAGARRRPRPRATNCDPVQFDRGRPAPFRQDFLVLPNQEHYGSPVGGHTDLLFSHPVYLDAGPCRQPAARRRQHPKYGKVYHIGSADDLMEMAEARRRAHLHAASAHEGIDRLSRRDQGTCRSSTTRTTRASASAGAWASICPSSGFCEYRCQPLFDDMSNWLADTADPARSTSCRSREVRYQAAGRRHLRQLAGQLREARRAAAADDVTPLIRTLMRGDYFVTSGEVLIPDYRCRGAAPGAPSRRMWTGRSRWTSSK